MQHFKRHGCGIYSCEKAVNMKKASLIVLFLIAVGLLFIGIRIHPDHSAFKSIFLIAGAIASFIFYTSSFSEAMKNPELNKQKRTMWIGLMVCVPLIGNLIYLFNGSTENEEQSLSVLEKVYNK